LAPGGKSNEVRPPEKIQEGHTIIASVCPPNIFLWGEHTQLESEVLCSVTNAHTSQQSKQQKYVVMG